MAVSWGDNHSLCFNSGFNPRWRVSLVASHAKCSHRCVVWKNRWNRTRTESSTGSTDAFLTFDTCRAKVSSRTASVKDSTLQFDVFLFRRNETVSSEFFRDWFAIRMATNEKEEHGMVPSNMERILDNTRYWAVRLQLEWRTSWQAKMAVEVTPGSAVMLWLMSDAIFVATGRSDSTDESYKADD